MDEEFELADAGKSNVLELGKLLPTLIAGNMRGLKPGIKDNKLEYLEMIANENDAIVIAITETHLKDRIDDTEIHINGYLSTRSD